MAIGTRLGIVLASGAILAGPMYTEPGYNWISNSISELGGQNTRNNWIMIVGFLSLGLGLIVDYLRGRRSRSDLPFVIFGFSFALAGLFPIKPFIEGVPYNEFSDSLHSLLATVAGIAVTVGFIGWALRVQNIAQKPIGLVLAAICFGLPLLMLREPQFDGLVQRLMYACVFVWLFFCYPTSPRTELDA